MNEARSEVIVSLCWHNIDQTELKRRPPRVCPLKSDPSEEECCTHRPCLWAGPRLVWRAAHSFAGRRRPAESERSYSAGDQLPQDYLNNERRHSMRKVMIQWQHAILLPLRLHHVFKLSSLNSKYKSSPVCQTAQTLRILCTISSVLFLNHWMLEKYFFLSGRQRWCNEALDVLLFLSWVSKNQPHSAASLVRPYHMKTFNLFNIWSVLVISEVCPHLGSWW